MEVEALPQSDRRLFPNRTAARYGDMGLDLFLRLPDVKVVTALSKTTIYSMIARNAFPRPIKLGPNKVAWSAKDIAEWQTATRKRSAA